MTGAYLDTPHRAGGSKVEPVSAGHTRASRSRPWQFLPGQRYPLIGGSVGPRPGAKFELYYAPRRGIIPAWFFWAD